jgi:hypothetical protein
MFVNIVAFVCSLIFTFHGRSDDGITQDPKAVVFFKQALSSPPDVDGFVAGQRNVGTLPGLKLLSELKGQKEAMRISDEMKQLHFQYGARSGSNFFVGVIDDSNPPSTLGKMSFVQGCAGNSIYSVGQNEVTYGIGSNVEVQIGKSARFAVNQYLNMGLAEIKTKSVVWTGDNFMAQDNGGINRYGDLAVSNRLPFVLRIRSERQSPPYKEIRYFYANEGGAVDSYPTKMIISSPAKSGGLLPIIEITLSSVHLATHPLPEDFFSATRFLHSGVIYTNVSSNSDFYASDQKGKLKLLPSDWRNPNHPKEDPLTRRRSIMLAFSLLTLAGPLLIYLRSKKTKSK